MLTSGGVPVKPSCASACLEIIAPRRFLLAAAAAEDRFLRLTRLMIGQQVALAKWDSGKVVEDTPREAQVILGATKDGVAKGLDEASVSNFFKAQIEANKFVQYALLADWYRAGKAPEHAPVDLLKVIRPQLDEVQKSLIAELVDTAALRTSKTCRADVAKAVGKYVSTHAHGGGPINAATLDRSLAGACTL